MVCCNDTTVLGIINLLKVKCEMYGVLCRLCLVININSSAQTVTVNIRCSIARTHNEKHNYSDAPSTNFIVAFYCSVYCVVVVLYQVSIVVVLLSS